ncbi:hypothetical protein D3C75_1053220 [compost metagenome]
MDQIAQQTARISAVQRPPLFAHDDFIAHSRQESVDFLSPDAKHLAQLARVAPDGNQIIFVHDAAEISRNECAARLHEGFNLLGKSRLDHIQHRSDNNLVLGEVFFDSDHIGFDILLIQRVVIFMHFVHIIQRYGRSA